MKIDIKGSKTLIIGAIYLPHTDDIEGLEFFKTAAHRASQYNNASIWIAGDFNLPGIDWGANTIKPRTTSLDIHERFIEYLQDYNLEQVVKDPEMRTYQTCSLQTMCLS